MAPIEQSSDDFLHAARLADHAQIADLAAEVERLREVNDELLLERLEARNALWVCVKLTGADVSDGPPRYGTGDWPQLPELAVREVARLREEADSDG